MRTTRLLRRGRIQGIMFAAFRQSIEDPQSMISLYGKRAALFNPALVAGYPHLEFARIHTDMAFKRGENIARDYFIEFLVRISGRRQIEKAFDIGIRKGTYVGIMGEEEVIMIIEKDLGARDDSLLLLTEEKEEKIREFFEVSGSGKILQKNIFEKIALVSY